MRRFQLGFRLLFACGKIRVVDLNEQVALLYALVVLDQAFGDLATHACGDGHDIGFERALLDWIRKHREGWRAARRAQLQSMYPQHPPQHQHSGAQS